MLDDYAKAVWRARSGGSLFGAGGGGSLGQSGADGARSPGRGAALGQASRRFVYGVFGVVSKQAHPACHRSRPGIEARRDCPAEEGGRGRAEGCRHRPLLRLLPDGEVSEYPAGVPRVARSEEHTSELQSLRHLVCRLLLEKKKKCNRNPHATVFTPASPYPSARAVVW